MLAELGRAISQEFDVQYRALAMDLSQEGFIERLDDATYDLDIGLVVCNAGTGNPGEFLKHDRQLLQATLRLNTMAHLEITHHFGQKLGERRWGGIILVGALGAESGIPRMTCLVKGLPARPLLQTHVRTLDKRAANGARGLVGLLMIAYRRWP